MTQSAKEFEPEGAVVLMDTLAGKQLAGLIPSLNEGVEALSPSRRLFVTQPGLEPILRARAEQAGATVIEGTEVVGIEQDADGVTATISDVDSGDERQPAREVPHRRRRRAQQGARAARDRVRRPRRLLQRDHDLLPCAAGAVRRRQVAERHLREERRSVRLLPHGQGRQLGLPRRQHRGRHVAAGSRKPGQRRPSRAPHRAGATGRGRAGSSGDDRRRRAVAGDLRRRAPLQRRPRVPGRRCRAPDAAQRWLRRQHRHSRRPQPRLEAGDGAEGRCRTARCSRPTRPSGVRSGSSPSSRRTRATSRARRRISAPRTFSRSPTTSTSSLATSTARRRSSPEDDIERGSEDPRESQGRPGSRAPHLWIETERAVSESPRSICSVAGSRC